MQKLTTKFMYNMFYFMKDINFSYGHPINKKDWKFLILYGMINSRKGRISRKDNLNST